MSENFHSRILVGSQGNIPRYFRTAELSILFLFTFYIDKLNCMLFSTGKNCATRAKISIARDILFEFAQFL